MKNSKANHGEAEAKVSYDLARPELLKVYNRPVVGSVLCALPEPALWSALQKLGTEDHWTDGDLRHRIPVAAAAATGIKFGLDACPNRAISVRYPMIEFAAEPESHMP
jgi:hypothetical protein